MSQDCVHSGCGYDTVVQQRGCFTLLNDDPRGVAELSCSGLFVTNLSYFYSFGSSGQFCEMWQGV